MKEISKKRSLGGVILPTNYLNNSYDNFSLVFTGVIL